MSAPRTAPPVIAEPETLLSIGALPPPAEPAPWETDDEQDEAEPVALEFFTVSELASATSRSVRTLNNWQRDGILPHSRYTIPRRGINPGRRQYTERQVQAVADALDSGPASLVELGAMIHEAWAAQGAIADMPEPDPVELEETEAIVVDMTGSSRPSAGGGWTVLV